MGLILRYLRERAAIARAVPVDTQWIDMDSRWPMPDDWNGRPGIDRIVEVRGLNRSDTGEYLVRWTRGIYRNPLLTAIRSLKGEISQWRVRA